MKGLMYALHGGQACVAAVLFPMTPGAMWIPIALFLGVLTMFVVLARSNNRQLVAQLGPPTGYRGLWSRDPTVSDASTRQERRLQRKAVRRALRADMRGIPRAQRDLARPQAAIEAMRSASEGEDTGAGAASRAAQSLEG